MSGPPTITLRPGRERSLLRRHPWVFSGAVQRTQGSTEPGTTVAVRGSDGRFLAWAAASPRSQIVARVWSFDEADVIDETFVARRITASAERRAGLWPRTDSARIVFSESDGVPGVIADRYGEWVVVELTTAGSERWRDEIGRALAALPGVEGVYERSDIDVRKREGLPERTGSLAGAEPPDEIVIHEAGMRFAVDVRRGHKTGFYLDQRESRRVCGELADGRLVLNTFCYTGGFTIAALGNGASEVISVDSSGPALAIARRNVALNGFDVTGAGHDADDRFVEADVFGELRRRKDRGEKFGMVILDPPKLAHRADQVDKSTRAYKDINLQAFQLLEPGGVLLTFSCSGLVTEDLFQKVVAGAALDARREARIVGHLHQASDHPVHLAVPETAYLKGLVVEVS